MGYPTQNRGVSSRRSVSCLLLAGLLLAVLCFPLAAQADGGAPNLVYASGSRQGVGIIDVAQEKLARELPVVGQPNMLLLSADGGLLYVTQPASGLVNFLATKTGQLICSVAFPGHPGWLGLSIDGTVLYVAGLNERAMLAVDARTCVVQSSFQAPEPVSWLAVTGYNAGNSLQTQLWLAGGSGVSILDARGKALDSIPVPGGPRFLCLPNGLTAYIVTRQGSVLAADMLSHRVFATLLSGGPFGTMDYNAVTGEIYVPDLSQHQIDVLVPVLAGAALTPQEPVRRIRVSSSPHAIAITNDGQFGFVARDGGMVDMLDIPGHNLIRSIHTGGAPLFVIAGPYPPQNVPTPILAPADVVPVNPFLSIGLIFVFLMVVFPGALWLLWKRSKKSHRRIQEQSGVL